MHPTFYAFETIIARIKYYVNNLTKGKSASKLSYARMLTSDRITKLFDDYHAVLIPSLQTLINKGAFNSEALIRVFCQMLLDAKQDPLLKAFLAELYDLYKKTTHSDRITMSDYFKIEEDTLRMMLVRGDVNGWKNCFNDLDIPLKQLRSALLGNLTYLKAMVNNAVSFLQKTRLDGRFFR